MFLLDFLFKRYCFSSKAINCNFITRALWSLRVSNVRVTSNVVNNHLFPQGKVELLVSGRREDFSCDSECWTLYFILVTRKMFWGTFILKHQEVVVKGIESCRACLLSPRSLV